MAKREIPEINAGSMADIAFLLLIFFLVTTTMEKDTAYIRPIPKKLDIPVEPVKIDDRNICVIKANSANQLMVRGDIMKDPDKISEKVVEFYRMNENLSKTETNQFIQNKGYQGYNFPFYSRVTLDQIADEMDRNDQELALAEEDDNEDMIIFYEKSLDEWSKKKSAMSTLGIKELKEIQVQAHVRIEVQQQTDYKFFAKIHSEVQEAISELRDEAAKKYFDDTYTKMMKRLTQDKEDKNGDKRKVEALKVLYPDRIIEVRPK
jgi:biopolymer transport protein ExbD